MDENEIIKWVNVVDNYAIFTFFAVGAHTSTQQNLKHNVLQQK